MAQRFSMRTGWDTGESALAEAIREARAAGKPLLDLTISNPTICGFEYDREAILGALGHAAAMTYEADPRGVRSARVAVAGYYHEHHASVDPDHLILTTSTSEAYSFLLRLLCDAGDAVLAAQPSYPLFDYLAGLDDVHLETYPLFYDYGWHIDFAELERRIGARTRAIVLVHPNNPTGHATSRGELTCLLDICVRHGLALIVDEVFLDYGVYGMVETVASLSHPCVVFVVSGLSKIAALPQMKVGWILCLGPEQIRREALARLEVIADTFLSLSAPTQLALPEWLAGRGAIQRQIVARMPENLEVLAGMTRIALLPVQAGWSAILRLPQFAAAEDIAVTLVQDAGLVVHPGSFYGMAGDHFVVVSIIGPVESLRFGVKKLEQWCESKELM